MIRVEAEVGGDMTSPTGADVQTPTPDLDSSAAPFAFALRLNTGLDDNELSTDGEKDPVLELTFHTGGGTVADP